MAPKRRAVKKIDPKLRAARDRIRLLREAVDLLRSPVMTIDTETGRSTAKFIQAWAVQRGYSGVTQALDSDGNIWERHTKGSKVDGAYVIEDSWWVPIPMERRP